MLKRLLLATAAMATLAGTTTVVNHPKNIAAAKVVHHKKHVAKHHVKKHVVKKVVKQTATKQTTPKKVKVAKKANAKKTTAKKVVKKHKKSRVEAALRTPIDPKKPSEKLPYPNLKKVKHFWIKVSVMKNRVYLMDGKKCIYIMYCTAGKITKKNGKYYTPTPLGTHYIQAERGKSFFLPQFGQGAQTWVSYKNHGEFLFHSVLTDRYGRIIKSEAKKLGKKSGSHGCIRLSLPDAKWMNRHAPVGTKVVIHLN